MKNFYTVFFEEKNILINKTKIVFIEATQLVGGKVNYKVHLIDKEIIDFDLESKDERIEFGNWLGGIL